MADDSSASTRLFHIDELAEAVFVFLQNDKSSLKTCSLVCKSWDAHAIRPLFRSLSLRPSYSRRWGGLQKQYEPIDGQLQGHRITRNVRHLSIVYIPPIEVPLQHLANTLATFPFLRSLDLATHYGFTYSSPTSAPFSLPDITGSRPQLESLAIDIHSASFKDVPPCALFALFAEVKSLVLTFNGLFDHSMTSAAGEFDVELGLSKAFSIRSLMLRNFDANMGHAYGASELLSSSLDCSQIKSFVFDNLVPGCRPGPVNDLLRICGARINTFGLSLRRHHDVAFTPPPPCM